MAAGKGSVEGSSAAPAVSVIMAVYNGERDLAAALASLYAQSFTDFEIVLVDDGSTDGTHAILERQRDPRLRVFEMPANGGVVAARNRAFAEARGRYIAALDHDDLAHPERFARQVAYLDAHPDVVMVGTAAEILIASALSPPPPAETTPDLIDWLMRFSNPLVWSSVMFRADAAHALDTLMREERLYAEDFDLHLRMRAFGRIARIDEPLAIYRSAATGMSQRHHAGLAAQSQRLIEETNRPQLGPGSASAAALIVPFIMLGQPIPDPETLSSVSAVLARITDDQIERVRPAAHTVALMRRHMSRLWWRLCRAAVRSGQVPVRAALAVRPAEVSWRDGRPFDLAISAAIGAVRARRQRR